MRFFRLFVPLFSAFLLLSFGADAFCGFYVAVGNAKLFNKTSQVIVARKGKRNIVTMANDFSGSVKDFAIVVPVPVVLQQKDIRVMENSLFKSFDDYSAPRLVEYWDQNPCEGVVYESISSRRSTRKYKDNSSIDLETTKLSGVKIEAQYKVEEYDILILSASKSTGLADWLKENGYNLPPQAAEVLEPYIKNDLKFFVVKVNLKEYNGKGFKQLRPIQIEYEYERFMLPIRLGMANANGEQDLIVYCLSDVGRVETVNYRTARIPTDKNVPEMVKANFGPFYKKTYDNFWAKEGKNAVVLEYFWDISGFQPVKCDPCPGPQLTYAQMKSAGAFWITETPNGMGGYDGPLYFTRLHARYNRQLYPQDFAFQAVPSKENFQGRYIVTHPAQGAFDCEEGKKYIEELQKRQALEWANYNELTAATAAKDSTGKNLLPVSTPNDAPPTGGFPVSQIFLLIGFAGVVFILLLGLERGLRYLTVRLR